MVGKSLKILKCEFSQNAKKEYRYAFSYWSGLEYSTSTGDLHHKCHFKKKFFLMTLLSLGTKIKSISQFQFCLGLSRSHNNASPKNHLYLKLYVDHSCNWSKCECDWQAPRDQVQKK